MYGVSVYEMAWKLLHQSGGLMFPLESRGITQMISQRSLQKNPPSHLKFYNHGLEIKDEITTCSLFPFPHTTQLFMRDMKLQ